MVTEITKATMHRIDQGKICALANAGWSVETILGTSDSAVTAGCRRLLKERRSYV